MSAKLLMGLSEENPELEKQIGCMTGIFQVFDRHHLITGRRPSTHKRLPSSGQSRSSSNTYNEEHIPGSPQIVLEYNRNKSLKENGRVSLESSASLSSSPSSSFSSLECRKATKPRRSDTEAKLSRNDFRDVVKNSINAETRVLSVKTSAKQGERKDNVLKHRDSPRPIMSVDLNDSLRVLARLKDAPWNASEVPRFSCDGREISRNKSSTKLREIPRFSLDSREVSLQGSNFDTQTKEMDRGSLNRGIPSVVAKLMGLEAMPSSGCQEPMELAKHNTKKSSDALCGDDERDHTVHSLMSSHSASENRMLKNAGPVSKHSSKQTESVYSQIERRVKELEFSESNKDLRALKRILDTMQAKGILESKESNNQQTKLSSQKNQNLKLPDSQNPQITTPRAFESPIVIMKPAKSVRRPGELESLSGLRKLRTSDSANRMKAKDQAPKVNDQGSSQRIQVPLMQRSPRPQQSARERSGSPAKNLSCSSPRVQQRKLEPEKKPRPSTRKKNVNRKPLEPVCTNDNLRVKPSRAQADDQQSKRADEISQREDGDIMMNQKIEDSSSTDDSVIISGEQPSPISVLEAVFYQDDLPLSPVKNISCAIEDDDCKNSMRPVSATPSKLSSEIRLQKLDCIKNLVEKLRQLSSTDDDDDHACQILVSAGLVSKDLASNAERLHQDLMFDVVKDILVRKLESMSPGPQPDQFLRSRKVSGQHLFAELCAEIEKLLVKRPKSTSLEEEELAFLEDLLRQSDEGWEDFGVEVPGLVLEIERSIFKDLIDEIVSSEPSSSGLQSKASRRRRQLFV